MSKKNILFLQPRFFSLLLALFMVASIAFVSSVGFIFSGTVSAAGTEFAYYYNSDDPAAVKNLAKDLEANGGKNRGGTYIGQTKILVRNGPGGHDMVLGYDRDTTDKIMVQGGGGADDSDEYYYSTTLYCSVNDHKITTEKPSGSAEYLKMLYVVGVKFDNVAKSAQLSKSNTLEGGAGIERSERITPSTGGGASNSEQQFDHRNNGLDPDDLGDAADDEIKPKACNVGTTDENVANYGTMSKSEKDSWKDLAAKAKSDTTSSGSGDGEKEVDCDNTFDGGPLSWIACPIIDMGVSFTDFVFKDFVQPMLENVPVSTNPEDGSYKAWAQFRLIANILLIGSLLAIVYSQARGGGGK